MIFYASLMLKILDTKSGNDQGVLEELDRLPSGLGELYEQRLKQIEDIHLAKVIFQWLVNCRRLLTVDGLMGAYTITKAIQGDIKVSTLRIGDSWAEIASSCF